MLSLLTTPTSNTSGHSRASDNSGNWHFEKHGLKSCSGRNQTTSASDWSESWRLLISYKGMVELLHSEGFMCSHSPAVYSNMADQTGADWRLQIGYYHGLICTIVADSIQPRATKTLIPEVILELKNIWNARVTESLFQEQRRGTAVRTCRQQQRSMKSENMGCLWKLVTPLFEGPLRFYIYWHSATW